MTDKTVQQTMAEVYSQATGQKTNNWTFAKDGAQVHYLDNVLADVKQLLTLLTDPAINIDAINANIQQDLQGRTQKESFVSPDLIAALPALGRNMGALDGFIQKAAEAGIAQAHPINDLELSQGYLHWEPFDQFRTSAMVLRDALNRTYPDNTDKKVTALKETVSRIVANCGEDIPNDPRLDFILSGSGQARMFDGVCIAATDDLAGRVVSRSRPVTSAEITLESGGDRGKETILMNAMRNSVQQVVSQVSALSDKVSQLSERDKEAIRALMGAYADQCTLPGGPDLHGVDLISVLPQRSAGINGLSTVLNNMTSNVPVVLQQEQRESIVPSAGNPWEAVNTLRMPVRALSAILSTLNDDGKYDGMLRMANEITGKCWRVQQTLGLNPALAENVQANAQRLVNPKQDRAGDGPGF